MTPLFKQLLNSYAEEAAIEEFIGALRRSVDECQSPWMCWSFGKGDRCRRDFRRLQPPA